MYAIMGYAGNRTYKTNTIYGNVSIKNFVTGRIMTSSIQKITKRPLISILERCKSCATITSSRYYDTEHGNPPRVLITGKICIYRIPEG